MTRKTLATSLALLLLSWGFLATSQRAAADLFCCCPKTVFCRPKPPHIKYKCVCPKPVCCPCDIENFGYYPTCWRAWPYPPNYCHCPVPPTIATAPCSPIGAPNLESLHQPQPVPTKPGL